MRTIHLLATVSARPRFVGVFDEHDVPMITAALSRFDISVESVDSRDVDFSARFVSVRSQSHKRANDFEIEQVSAERFMTRRARAAQYSLSASSSPAPFSSSALRRAASYWRCL